MSPLSPSFQTIYRQGRFRERPVPGSKKTMHQGERFAVACLGFILHHDETFRERFLAAICDWEQADTARQFVIFVELDGCGDLALVAEDLRVVFVLECKIRAPLYEHQDPDSQSFLTKGYGFGILQKYTDSVSIQWNRNYITLTQER